MNIDSFNRYLKQWLNRNYAFPTKGKVTKSYTSGGYWIDCQKVMADGSLSDVIIPKVEVPRIWGTPQGGIFCLPAVDSIVNVGFYDGDINRPFVLSVVGSEALPQYQINELLIVNGGAEIAIKPSGRIRIKTATGNLKNLLSNLIDRIAALKTTGTTPSPTATGTYSVSPDDRTALQLIKNKELQAILED